LKSVHNRVESVRAFRIASAKEPTRRKASTPFLFTEDRQPDEGNYLAVPRTSSENRAYIPIAFLSSDVIAANDIQMVPNATPFHFGVLQSKMHMAWVGTVTGRLESRLRYSSKIAYNNFPWPDTANASQVNAVVEAAKAVLDARAGYPECSLADLYDPASTPPELVKAHAALDRAVEKCYRPESFKDDRERVEFLFQLYERIIAPLAPAEQTKKRRRIVKV